MNNNYFDIKNTVTKSNQLIESSHKLTLQQQKIICAVASKVRITDTEFTEYVFHMKELAKLLELNQKGYYAEIRKVIRSLQTQVFTINKVMDEEVKSIDLNWFYRAEYNETKNTVSLKFAEDLKPFLIHLKGNFTSYYLENIVQLSSSYSLRIYEILRSKVFRENKDYKKNKEFEISLEELYSMILNQYQRYTDFKKNVLEKCRIELKNKTDIDFSYKEIKTGRKVTALKFFIKLNTLDEIAATKINLDSQVPISTKLKENKYIEKVKSIMYDHEITSLEAERIYNSSEGNFETIDTVYKNFKTKQVDNFVGVMISMVKPGIFQKPKSNVKKNTFNDYEQRQYNFNELEKVMLGEKNIEDTNIYNS